MRICTTEGCGRKHYARGYCAKHYRYWQARGLTGNKCTIDGCDDGRFSNGYCKMHYDRFLRHGDPNVCLTPMAPRGLPKKWLLDHISHDGDDCLAWPFARFPDGRAHMGAGKPSRIMCELAHGKPPTRRHEAAHSCGKGHEACVNPKHLYWATPIENSADKERHGTLLRGEQLPQSKLKTADVLAIRALKGQKFQREIAKQFGVSPTQINKILKGKAWRTIQP